MGQSTLSDPDRVLSPRRTQEMTGLSRTTIWRLRREGDFPHEVRLSAKRIGYRAGELAQWLAARSGSQEAAVA